MVATIHVSLSHNFHNKRTLRKHKTAFVDFESAQITPQSLYDHATSGKGFCVAGLSGKGHIAHYRHESKFVESQIIALDLDNDVSVADCLNHPFVAEYASFVYPSASSTPDYGKSRVVFVLDRPITDKSTYRQFVLAVMDTCKALDYDSSCKDPVRFFYGSDVRGGAYIGHVLPIAIIESLVQEQAATLKRTEALNKRIIDHNAVALSDDYKKRIAQKYALNRLESASQELASTAKDGGRFGGRYRAAFSLGFSVGTLVGAGALDYALATNAMEQAARAAGLSDKRARNAINGIHEGMKQPDDLSWITERKENTHVYRQLYDTKKASKRVIKPPEPLPEAIVKAASQFDERGLPDRFKAATLTAIGTNTDAPFIVDKMIQFAVHDDGEYSVADIAKITGNSEKTIYKWIKPLAELGYFYPSLIPKEETVLGIKSGEKLSTGRKSETYRVNLDRLSIINSLCDAIERRLRESFYKDDTPVLSESLAQAVGIDDKAAFDDLSEIARFTRAEPANAHEKRLQRDLRGDGKSWGGWRAELMDCSRDTFTSADTNKTSDWRRAYFELLVADKATRVNEQWQRLLGTLSSGTVSKIKTDLGYRSQENVVASKRFMIPQKLRNHPSNIKNFAASRMQQAAIQHEGAVIATTLYLKGDDPIKTSHFKSKTDDTGDVWTLLEQWSNKVIALEFSVQTASTYVRMEADEIEAKQAEKQAQPAPDDVQNEIESETEPIPEQPLLKFEGETTILDYDPAWLSNWISAIYFAVVGDTPPIYLTPQEAVEDMLFIWRQSTARITPYEKQEIA